MIAWHSGPTVDEKQRRADGSDHPDARARQRAEEPGEPGQREEETNAALRTAGPDEEPAPDERPPHGQVSPRLGQGLARTGQPFRSEAEHQPGQPRSRPEARTRGGQAVTRGAQPAHSPTARSSR